MYVLVRNPIGLELHNSREGADLGDTLSDAAQDLGPREIILSMLAAARALPLRLPLSMTVVLSVAWERLRHGSNTVANYENKSEKE